MPRCDVDSNNLSLQLDAIGTYIRLLTEAVGRLEAELTELHNQVNELMPAARKAAVMMEKRSSLLKLVTGG